MIEIKVTTPAPSWPWARQFPNSTNEWGPFRFWIDCEIDSCDAWVVFESIRHDEQVLCPPDRLIFISGEASTIGRYNNKFLNQFSLVISSNKNIEHTNTKFMQQGHPWFIEKTYDELIALEPMAKSEMICMIISDKDYSPGHKKRLGFAEKLKEHFGDQLHIYGKGICDFDSKWDLLSRYMYTVVLENAQENDFITEKLPDALMSYCFPFYSGAPNLKQYFDERSCIYLNIDDPKSCIDIIEGTISNPIHYQSSLPALSSARWWYLNNLQFFPNMVTILQNLFSCTNDSKKLVKIKNINHQILKENYSKNMYEKFKKCFQL